MTPTQKRLYEMVDGAFYANASSTELKITRICTFVNIAIIIAVCFYETIEGWFK